MSASTGNQWVMIWYKISPQAALSASRQRFWAKPVLEPWWSMARSTLPLYVSALWGNSPSLAMSTLTTVSGVKSAGARASPQ